MRNLRIYTLNNLQFPVWMRKLRAALTLSLYIHVRVMPPLGKGYSTAIGYKKICLKHHSNVEVFTYSFEYLFQDFLESVKAKLPSGQLTNSLYAKLVDNMKQVGNGRNSPITASTTVRPAA